MPRSLVSVSVVMPSHFDGLNNICDSVILTSTFFAAIIGNTLVMPIMAQDYNNNVTSHTAFHTFIAFILFIMSLIIALTMKCVIPIIHNIDGKVGDSVDQPSSVTLLKVVLLLVLSGLLTACGVGVLTAGVICRLGMTAIGDTTCKDGSILLLVVAFIFIVVGLCTLVPCNSRKSAPNSETDVFALCDATDRVNMLTVQCSAVKKWQSDAKNDFEECRRSVEQEEQELTRTRTEQAELQSFLQSLKNRQSSSEEKKEVEQQIVDGEAKLAAQQTQIPSLVQQHAAAQQHFNMAELRTKQLNAMTTAYQTLLKVAQERKDAEEQKDIMQKRKVRTPSYQSSAGATPSTATAVSTPPPPIVVVDRTVTTTPETGLNAIRG